MSDIQFQERAQTVFQTLCHALDAKKIPYQKRQEPNSIACRVSAPGGTYPMSVTVYENRQLLTVICYFDWTVPEDKSMDMALCVCHVNRKMADGCFDFSLTEGRVVYRMSHSFADIAVSEAMVFQEIAVAAQTVAVYEPSLRQVASGEMTVAQLTAQ